MTAWAASQGIARCETCEKLHRVPSLPPGARMSCSRCGTKMGLRKADSLRRTWCFLIAAYVFYVPANLFPVMIVSHLGRSQADTIFTGVITMFQAGWWAVGSLIFVASIMVPGIKLLVLTLLLLSVHLRRRQRPADRTRLYRIVEIIGHWSMLDVFVVSITVALIQLGALANVRAGEGASWFAAVVVLTMLAAMSFDPRLIWDGAGQPEGSEGNK